MSTFQDFVREQEGTMSPAAKALNDAYAAYYAEKLAEIKDLGVIEPTYLTLRIDDPQQARELISDLRSNLGEPLLSPVHENAIYAEVVNVQQASSPR